MATTANSAVLPQTPWTATAVATTANSTYTDTPTNTVLLAPLNLLNPSPLSVVVSTATVTITEKAHGRATADTITLAGATALGGITPTGAYQITVVDADTYTVIHGSNATSSATGGGSAVTVQSSRTSKNGVVVTSLTALARATNTASELQLYSSLDGGATKKLISSALLAAYTVAQTTKQAPADFGYTVSNPLIVGPTETLYVATGVSNTGIVFNARGAAF